MPAPRDAVARLLAVLGCLVLPFALTSAWTASTVTDTDAFVAATGPLAEDPQVRAAVADQVTTALVTSLDSAAESRRGPLEQFLGQQGADSLQNGLRGPLTTAVSKVVTSVLESPGFPQLWRAATRAAHQDVVTVLESDAPRVTADGQVEIRLDNVLRAVTQQLSRQGLPGADRLVPDELQVGLPIASVQDLDRARAGYQVLDRLGWWLPVITGALLLGALVLARHRSAILRLVGRGAVIGGALLVALLWGAQQVVAQANDRLDPAVTDALLTVLLAGLRQTVVVTILVGLAVAVLGTVLSWLGTRSTRSAGVVGTAIVGVIAVAAVVVAL